MVQFIYRFLSLNNPFLWLLASAVHAEFGPFGFTDIWKQIRKKKQQQKIYKKK